MPTADTTAGRPASWYDQLSSGSRAFLQFGFAGLFAVVFLWQQWESSRQSREVQSLLWEEIHSQRAEQQKRDEEQRAHREVMQRSVDALNRAVDEFRRASARK